MSSAASEHLKDFYFPEKGEMRDVVIRAGAGAGKTTELIRRVISLAWSEHARTKEWPKLVVTTFTRKATQELRERLQAAGLKIGNEGLLRYLQSSQNLHISTIHGILTVYLKKYGRELDLPPDFQIMDSLQANRLARRSLRALIKESPEFAADFQALLEETSLSILQESVEKFSALRFEAHPERLTLQELEHEYDGEQDWILTELAETVQELETLKLTETWQNWVGLFKGFLASQKDFPERVRDFNELAAGGQFRKTKETSAELVERARAVRVKIKEMETYAWGEEFRRRHEDLSVRFERLAKAWSGRIRDEKKRQARLTMEDLELFSLWLMEVAPDTAQSFSAEWDYWLIDEYQDTSPRQVKLIRSLTEGRKTFRVGDPQQSIYLFRGARSEVFIRAEDDVRDRGGDLFLFDENHRTEAPVLHFMNELFVNASAQLKGMKPRKPESEAKTVDSVTLWQVPEEKRSEGQQVEAVVHRIHELLAAGVSAESICVLARKRRDLGEIARRASALGLPCQLHASGGFFKRREVLDALSFLRFLVTPEDNENLVALLRSPWFPIGDQDLLLICSPSARSFWSRLREVQKDHVCLQESHAILERALARIRSEGVARVWRDLLVERGVFDEAKKIDPSGRSEANLWKLVQNLFDQEKKPGFRYSDFIDQPESVDTEETSGGDASPVIEPKRVQLMTIHASKGLQFPHVLVPFLNDYSVTRERSFFAWSESEGKWGLCLRDPDTNEISGPQACERSFDLDKERGIEELDRLFYVALTRAQTSLSLFWGRKAKGPWAEQLEQLAVAEEENEREWRAKVRDDLPSPESLARSKPIAGAVRAPWRGKATAGLRQTLSVTQLLEDTEPAKKSAGSGVQSWEKIRRSVRGTEVHRLMESLKFDPDRKLATKEFKPALDFLEGPRGAFLPELIRQGEVEYGFAVRLGTRLVQGQIDLWGRDREGRVWIIDYKTGTPEHSDKALRQLEIYSWALRRLKKIKDDETVLLAAVFPFHDEVVKREAPSGLDIQRALEERLNVLEA